MKEGEEALDENTKLLKMKHLRLEKLARMFWAPEDVEALKHPKNVKKKDEKLVLPHVDEKKPIEEKKQGTPSNAKQHEESKAQQL